MHSYIILWVCLICIFFSTFLVLLPPKFDPFNLHASSADPTASTLAPANQTVPTPANFTHPPPNPPNLPGGYNLPPPPPPPGNEYCFISHNMSICSVLVCTGMYIHNVGYSSVHVHVQKSIVIKNVFFIVQAVVYVIVIQQVQEYPRLCIYKSRKSTI